MKTLNGKLVRTIFKKNRNRANTNEQLNKKHFFYIKFFICTYAMSAAERIEPSALQLSAQHLAAERKQD